MTRIRLTLLVTTVAAVVGASVGLGANTKAAASKAPLRFMLNEMTVMGPTTAKSGRVTFTARNQGTVEHELVVMRGSGSLILKNFKAVEAGRAIGEVAETAPGKSGSVTLNLKPGLYLLVCNIVGHYQLGMQSLLRVS